MNETIQSFFKRRLRELRLYDDQTEHAGMIGEAVEALADLFAGQEHDGPSSSLTAKIFSQLMNEWHCPTTVDCPLATEVAEYLKDIQD